MKIKFVSSLIILSIALTACAAKPIRVNVQITTDKPTYKFGDVIGVIVNNNSSVPLYSIDQRLTCGIIEVEKKIDDRWTQIENNCHLGFPRGVTKVGTTGIIEKIDTNGAHGIAPIYDPLTPGSYRIKLNVAYSKKGELSGYDYSVVKDANGLSIVGNKGSTVGNKIFYSDELLVTP